MTKFEREQMSQLNRAMDRYRDALKRVVVATEDNENDINTLELQDALEAARELLK